MSCADRPCANSAADHAPMKSLHFAKFVGDHWEPFGELMTYERAR